MKYLLKFNEASLSPDPHFSVDLSNINTISDLKYRLSLKSVHIIPVEEVDKKYGSQFLSKSNICGIYGGFIGFENKKNIQNPKIIIAADEDILSNSLKDKRLFQIINNTMIMNRYICLNIKKPEIYISNIMDYTMIIHAKQWHMPKQQLIS